MNMEQTLETVFGNDAGNGSGTGTCVCGPCCTLRDCLNLNNASSGCLWHWLAD